MEWLGIKIDDSGRFDFYAEINDRGVIQGWLYKTECEVEEEDGETPRGPIRLKWNNEGQVVELGQYKTESAAKAAATRHRKQR